MPYRDPEVRRAKAKICSAMHYQRKREAMTAAGHVFKKPKTAEEKRGYHREWNRLDRLKNPEKQKAILRKSVAKHFEARSQEKRAYEKENPDKIRNFRRRTRYGITSARFEEMETAQDGRCAICREEKALVIDHCHTSGVVRGLLCKTCNAGLGMFRDNPDWLSAAAVYLEASKTNGSGQHDDDLEA